MPDRAAIQWVPEFEVGIPFIDKDHKILVSLLNQVSACVHRREEMFVVHSVVNALLDYTRYHFGREERFQEMCGFDGLNDHMLEHTLFTARIAEISQRFLENPESVTAIEVRDFLSAWLTHHITETDPVFCAACADRVEELGPTIDSLRFLGVSDGSALQWSQRYVLLVDDNVNFRRLVETLLRALGVRRLESLGSPLEALDKLRRMPVDVVISDWIMDDMAGPEFARKISELGVPAKVVMMSGYDIDTKREREMGTGVSTFLQKPLSAISLYQAVETALA